MADLFGAIYGTATGDDIIGTGGSFWIQNNQGSFSVRAGTGDIGIINVVPPVAVTYAVTTNVTTYNEGTTIFGTISTTGYAGAWSRMDTTVTYKTLIAIVVSISFE